MSPASPLPRVIVTGASGFLGRRLVQRLRRRWQVLGIDRLPPHGAERDEHPNVRWYQIDLADAPAVEETFEDIRAGGGARVLVHLAAYYDFTGEAHPEYQRTNIEGTRILVDACAGLGLERFVFASSTAACPLNREGTPITEDTPASGTHIYAVSKRIGEEMLRAGARDLPAVSIRFGAMFSDWCEYPPLYVFLDTWLSERWNARMLGGRGQATIPFLHVRDGVDFVTRVVERATAFAPFEVLIASHDGGVSHRELFDAATGYFYGRPREPRLMPRALAVPGMWARETLGRALGQPPFERLWMADYIDMKLNVDSTRTRQRLGWEPHPRLRILGRIPFMIENLKNDPLEWHRRNREVMEHHTLRSNVVLYRLLEHHAEAVVERLDTDLAGRGEGPRLPGFERLGPDERRWQARLLVRHLIQSVKSGEKVPFMQYCRELAEHFARAGADVAEPVGALRALDRAARAALADDPAARPLGAAIHDLVQMTVEFGIDQVLETFEDARSGDP